MPLWLQRCPQHPLTRHSQWHHLQTRQPWSQQRHSQFRLLSQPTSTPSVEMPASQEVHDVQRHLLTQYPRQQHQSHWQQQGTNDQRGTAAIIKVPGDTPHEGSKGGICHLSNTTRSGAGKSNQKCVLYRQLLEKERRPPNSNLLNH